MKWSFGRIIASNPIPLRSPIIRSTAASGLLLSFRGVTSTAQPRRPSPYRLIPPHTFLAAFAPLHVAGWRLAPIPSKVDTDVPPKGHVEDGTADLQDRRLVRLYEFEMGKQGWRHLMRFMGKVGDIVAAQDHHPKILISPTQDYTSTVLDPVSPQSGYMLEISSHTHTPLPALRPGETGSKEVMRPGVTTKDLNLAEAVEAIWGNLPVTEEP